nr:gustatory receptor 23.2 [Papilio polytes]
MSVNQRSAVDIIGNRIVNCMKPLLYVEYCFGIFRYRLDERSSEVINLRMKIICVAIASAWIAIFCCSMPFINVTFNNMVALADYWMSYLIVITYACSVLMLVLWQSQDNRKVIEIFAVIDISLHANIDQKVYNLLSRQCKILFTAHITFCIICIVIYSYFCMYDNKIAYLFFSLIYFERKIEICVFCLFLYMLKQRILLINNYLSKFSGDQDNVLLRQGKVKRLEIDFIGKISNTNNKVRDLASVYCKIGKVCLLINKIYNSLIFMTIVTTFIFIIVLSWSILYSYKVNDDDLIFSLSMSFYVFSDLFSIMFISYYSESISLVNDKLKNMLNRILTHNDLPIFMMRQVNVFVKLIRVWDLKINVFDMIDVNIILVLKFISMCTSYLIVLIQINRLI